MMARVSEWIQAFEKNELKDELIRIYGENEDVIRLSLIHI